MDIRCARCPMILDEPGGLLFGPPKDEISGIIPDRPRQIAVVPKIHLCVECWNDLMGLTNYWETYRL